MFAYFLTGDKKMITFGNHFEILGDIMSKVLSSITHYGISQGVSKTVTRDHLVGAMGAGQS